MNKAQWFFTGMAACVVVLVCMAATYQTVVSNEVYTAIIDPNDNIYKFLEPVDPNWLRDFGDNERTRVIYTVSVNRGRILRDEQVMSLMAQRLIALESLHIEELKALTDPNGPAAKGKHNAINIGPETVK